MRKPKCAIGTSQGFAAIVSNLLVVGVWASDYSIDWSTIDGGGGSSTGGVYAVAGTIGQPDAGQPSGGNYTLEGGFWGLIAAMQSPGAPLLSIRRADGNNVLVCWPYPSDGYGLLWSTNLNTMNWVAPTNVPAQVSNEWQIIVSLPPAMRSQQFYRLKKSGP